MLSFIHFIDLCTYLKFIHSEKAIKVFETSTLLLSVCTVEKSKVEIFQNFVAFSECTYLRTLLS